MTRREMLEASLKRRYGNRIAAATKGGPGQGGPGGRGIADKAANGKKKPQFKKETVKRLFAYVLTEKKRLIAAVFCVLLQTASNLAATYMLRPLINKYIVPMKFSEEVLKGLLGSLIIMLIIYLAGQAAAYIQSRCLTTLGQNSLKRIRKDLFDHMQTMPIKFYDENKRGDIMSRYTNDIDNIGNMISSTLISVFSAILTVIGYFALMLYTNFYLTLVVVVMIPAMLFVVSKIMNRAAKYFSLQQASLGAMNGYIEEMVTGQKVIKVFSHEDRAVEEFDILNDTLRKHQIKAQFFGGVMGPVMNFMNQVTYTFTSVFGGILCVLNGFDIGGLTVFLNYARQFQRPVNEIAQTGSTIFSALAGAERVFAVMDEKPEPENDKDAYIPSPMRGDIKFEHVYFGYNADKIILKDINLYAHPGQKIAFVGSTGAGKTTVTNLLNRFYDINEGSITIDGVDIRHYSMEELRKNIAVVLQDTHLFTGTVMENIRYGRSDATDEEVIEAAKTAYADTFIRRLPEGYNTMIEGDGANLSQGQRQLLNIARAAVSKAPVLVLDEATSSVDTRTEKYIEKGMDSLMKDRTTIVIAHRLSTVRNCNAIMVLEHGEIIERGTHDDLLNMKGRYYELYTGRAELD